MRTESVTRTLYRAALAIAAATVIAAVAFGVMKVTSFAWLLSAAAALALISALHLQTRMVFSAISKQRRSANADGRRLSGSINTELARVESKVVESVANLAGANDSLEARNAPPSNVLDEKSHGELIVRVGQSVNDLARAHAASTVLAAAEADELAASARLDRVGLHEAMTSIKSTLDDVTERCAPVLSAVERAVTDITAKIRDVESSMEDLLSDANRTKATPGHLLAIQDVRARAEELSIDASARNDLLSDLARQVEGLRALLIEQGSAIRLLNDQVQSAPNITTAGFEALSDAVAALEDARSSSTRFQRAIAEGFRATRVEIEQLPQAVDQYGMMRSALVGKKVSMPPSGGWAMTAGAISELVARVLESASAPTVLELGSGVSTVWASLAMRQRGNGVVYSLEHKQEFLDATTASLEEDGAPEYARLVLAPLVPVLLDGTQYEWYDTSQLGQGVSIDILVIDGPPGAGGRHARYPALPMLADRLKPGALILLDDTIRIGEREIISMWMECHPNLSIERRLEKATLLRWHEPK